MLVKLFAQKVGLNPREMKINCLILAWINISCFKNTWNFFLLHKNIWFFLICPMLLILVQIRKTYFFVTHCIISLLPIGQNSFVSTLFQHVMLLTYEHVLFN
jgi:hypothetical protein